jgi:hypothetical protein
MKEFKLSIAKTIQLKGDIKNATFLSKGKKATLLHQCNFFLKCISFHVPRVGMSNSNPCAGDTLQIEDKKNCQRAAFFRNSESFYALKPFCIKIYT